MTRDAFIDFLLEEKIEFSMNFDAAQDTCRIYVQGKPEEIISFNGEMTKYTPYLRFSHFDEKPGMMYVRDNGLCDYQTDEWCKAECIKYRDSFKEV